MQKDEVIRALECIRELVEHGWIQHYLASDERGKYMYPTDGRATCFCIVGASIRVAKDGGYHYSTLTDLLVTQLGDLRRSSLIAFNDSPFTTLKDVMRLIDKCIEAERTR